MPLTNQEREQLRYEIAYLTIIEEQQLGTDIVYFINNECGTGLMQKAMRAVWAAMNATHGG